MASKHPLTNYRADRGMTLEQLGELFGVNKTTVMRWEAGRVPADRVRDVSRVTGIPLEQLRPDLYDRDAAA